MGSLRPNLSVTLPSSFYNSPSDSAPRTPDRSVRSGLSTPLAEQTQARFRLRRRPGARSLSSQLFAPLSAQSDADSCELPIPSIEIANEDFDDTHFQSLSQQDDDFLSPLSSKPLFEAPKTPSAQTASFDGFNWSTSKQRESGETIARPPSSCSMWSDSSDDSDALSTVASSYGTSCTSPDRLMGDPFYTPSKEERFFVDEADQSTLRASQLSRVKKLKTSWTSAMDDHLWTSYQLYLQDPTATPIKTLPGNAPPLGVCHRVARQAKQSWREPKLRASVGRFSTPQPVGSPKMNLSQDMPVSDMEEPERRAKAGTWPKLAHTRRRLRELAKNRATIAPHYMRLIAGRTPSPFSSSSAHPSSRRTSNGPGSRQQGQSSKPDAMEARDVRLALVTATSETMHPDGPLAQLQRDTPQPTPEPVVSAPIAFNFNEPAVPFASPIAPPSMANRSSSVDLLMPDAPEVPRRLGSPFVPTQSHTWAAPDRQHARGALPSAFQAPPRRDAEDQTVSHLPRPSTSTGPRALRSPIHFNSSYPYNRSSGSKRRAEAPLEDTSSPRHISHRRPGLDVDQLFGPPLHSHSINRDEARSPVEQRRVRLRGFSLGDAIMQSQQDRQEAAAVDIPTFNLPESEDPFVDGDADASHSTSLPGVSLNVTAPRFLGSPFRLSENTSRPRRFKVRHLPHNSLDTYPEGLFGSIGERLEGGQ